MSKAVPAYQKSDSVTNAGAGFHASTQPTATVVEWAMPTLLGYGKEAVRRCV
ncbi:MAG: hypothetical protein H7Z11_04100, partial [Verrucomicrobia bacterium]|nr:hypothetical protein [Leptolyngbya sp. ES-bin-22]